MRPPLALLFSASLALSYATSSSAQPVDAATKATARQLGEEGMKAYDNGDCAGAADKLARAHDLVHVPTLAFYAGKCMEKLGRLVEAEEEYLEATRDPVEPGAPAMVKSAQTDADRARHALLPRIPSVLLTLQPPVLDALVTLDGKPLPPAMLGVKRPIDPGTHAVQVQRAGGVTSREFSVKEAEAASVVLDLPAPVGPAYPYPYPYAPPRGVPGYPPDEPPPAMRRRNTGLFVAGVVVAPVGAVAALVGAVVALEQGATDGSSAPGLALVGVGLLGIGGGIAMAVIGGKKVRVDAPPPPPVVSFEPLLGPTSVGVRGRF
jgi:hypothetical protein